MAEYSADGILVAGAGLFLLVFLPNFGSNISNDLGTKTSLLVTEEGMSDDAEIELFHGQTLVTIVLLTNVCFCTVGGKLFE